MGCYLLFRFLINETNPSPTSRIPFGTFGVFFFLLDDDVTASPYCYCDGDEEQRAGEIIEITSSPEPEGVVDTTPTLVVGHFEGLETLLEIPPLPETPPAGPSLAPEEREQAPSVGLNLDPSQSSRRLDGGERGANSSKRSSTLSLEELEESDSKFKVGVESLEARLEGIKRKKQLQAFGASPFETAKGELVTSIGENSQFRVGLLLSLDVKCPLTGKREALEKTIEAILKCQGKPTDSLASLLDLKCDLEDPEKLETALRPYLGRLGRFFKK